MLSAARVRRGGPARRTLRQLVSDDLPQTTWETLPAALTLSPGEVRLTFARIEELAAALAALASLLDRDLEALPNASNSGRRLSPTRKSGRTWMRCLQS